MRAAKKDIILYWKQKTVLPCREAKIRETIAKAREAYCMAESEKPLSKLEFLYCQSRYIRKYWWILQGFLLWGVWFFLQYTEGSGDIHRSVGVAAPLFVILILPEIWKNKNRNALEIESTTYYSLRQIYAARILLFAIVDFLFLSLFFVAVSVTGKVQISELIVQFFVPFNVACCICFCMLYSRRVRSETSAIFSCVVWTLIWEQLVLNDAVYERISAPLWAAMLALSSFCLFYVIKRGQKRYREIWEGKTVWN